MGVTAGAKPTELNFVDSDTSMASGQLGVQCVAGAAYPDPNNTSVNVRDLKLFGKIPVLSKGGLYTFDGTNLVALPVGTNGYVLTADSSLADGIKWAAAGGGGGGTLGTGNGGWSAADEIPGGGTIYDDEFNASSLSSQWTVVNGGSTVINVGLGVLQMYHPAHSGDDWTVLTESLPSPPWTFIMKISGYMFYPQNYNYFGIMLSDSSGKLIQFGGDNTTNVVEIQYWNSPTSYNANQLGATFRESMLKYLGVNDDGTNLNFFVSSDGIQTYTVKSLSRTAFLTSGPTLIGPGCGSNNGTYGCMLDIDYIRRTA